MKKIPIISWKSRALRPSLLMLTAVAAGASALAQTANLGKEEQKSKTPSEMQSRLGVVIEQDMAERDRAFARRTRAVDLREKSVQAAEQRLQATLGEQANVAPVGGAPAANESGAVSQSIEDLARIYQAMKPARAAAIFSALEPEVQTQIARHMRDRSVALVMASMEPIAAARLSMRLAGRNPAAITAPAVNAGARPLALAAPPPRQIPKPVLRPAAATGTVARPAPRSARPAGARPAVVRPVAASPAALATPAPAPAAVTPVAPTPTPADQDASAKH